MKNSIREKEEIINKEIFKQISESLTMETAKALLEEDIKNTLDYENELDLSYEQCKKYGDAIIYLKGIGEYEKVKEEIYDSEWYKGYYDKNGNRIK